MHDSETTIAQIKESVLALCRRKGWGDIQGIQNPQHVAMAMTVEMSELLEHFQWMNPEDVAALQEGRDSKRTALIAEEFADVMMYGMQLAYALGIDVSAQIQRKIDIVNKRSAKPDEPAR